MTGQARVFRLRTPARLIVRITPVWAALIALGLSAASVMAVAAAVSDESGAAPPLAVVVLGIVGFWTWMAVLWRPYLGFIREVRESPDGSLEIVTLLGKTASLEHGDVREVREQLLIPQPGCTRVRTHDGQTFYFWTFEDKYELVDCLRSLQD